MANQDNFIYDPLRKCSVERTPEEEVRQWIISILLGDGIAIPSHLMNSEVGFKNAGKQYRADVVAFNRNGEPLLIVECKRPNVPIDAKVCEQALRYDSVLSVKFILLTNGRSTYIFRREGAAFKTLDHIPSFEEMLLWQQ